VGNVYVVDPENFRIEKFDSDGTYLTVWGPDGEIGTGFIREPVGIAVDAAGNVFVADAWQSLILKYDASGNFMTAWGDTLDENGGMLSFRPTYLALDAAGNVFATDYYNNRVLKFDATGALLTAWGLNGNSPGEFSYPSGIAVDASGNVLVADTFNNRIQQFDSDGTFVTEWGSEGSDYGAFNWPMGICASVSGAIYVADTFNNRIQVFDFSAPPCIITSLLGETDYRTERMRHFRDAVLAHSTPGRRIVDLYGRTSARLQPVIDRSPLLKNVARIILKSALSAIHVINP
jgi:DNA-binding beta-propeller fold protein YncE